MDRYCKNCGKPLRGDNNFCTECGTPYNETGENGKQAYRKKTQKKTVIAIAAAAAVILAAGGIAGYNGYFKYEIKYKQAERLLKQEKYQQALDTFLELGDFKDSVDRVKKFEFVTLSRDNEYFTDTSEYEIEHGKVKKHSYKSISHIGGDSVETGETEYIESDGNKAYEYGYSEKDGVKINFNTEYTYDGDRLIKVNRIGDDYNETSDYKYDDKKNLISLNEKRTSNQGKAEDNKVSETSYEYDSNSKLQRKVYTKTDEGGNKTSYEQSYEGGKIKSEEYARIRINNSDGLTSKREIKSHEQYTYEEDRLISYTSEGESTSEYIFSDGYTRKDEDSSTYKYEIEYDNKGRVSAVNLSRNNDGKETNARYEFDMYGRTTHVENDKGEEIINEFDDYGNLTLDGNDGTRYTYQLVGYDEEEDLSHGPANLSDILGLNVNMFV